MTAQTFSSKSSSCLQQHWWAMQLQLSTHCRVTATRTHAHTHTHTRLHSTWSKHTTNSHTQSCLQSPKASNSRKSQSQLLSSCPQMRVWQKNRGHTHTRVHTHIHTLACNAKSKSLLLIHASAHNACRCQNALLGRVFFFLAWQWSRVCALIHVARRKEVFLEKIVYCFKLIGRRQFGSEAVSEKIASCWIWVWLFARKRLSIWEQFWWFFMQVGHEIVWGRKSVQPPGSYSFETNSCFLSTFMWITDICVGLCLIGELHYTIFSCVSFNCCAVNPYWLGNKITPQYRWGVDVKYSFKQISVQQLQPEGLLKAEVADLPSFPKLTMTTVFRHWCYHSGASRGGNNDSGFLEAAPPLPLALEQQHWWHFYLQGGLEAHAFSVCRVLTFHATLHGISRVNCLLWPLSQSTIPPWDKRFVLEWIELIG